MADRNRYAALAFYGQQFVDEEKGRNSKAILAADVMCDAWVSTIWYLSVNSPELFFCHDIRFCH